MNKKIQNFLDTTCNKIKYIPIREGIKNELYNHIIEGKDNYISNGLSEKEAEDKALEDIGNPEEISRDFNEIYKKKLDWKLLIILGLLLIINSILIITVFFKSNQDFTFIVRNISYILASIIISVGIYLGNYQNIKKYSLGVGILGIIFNIATILLNYNLTTNNGTNPIIENIYINPNIISTFLYILSFSAIISNIDKKMDLLKIGALVFPSLFLLYISSDKVLLTITVLAYIGILYTKITLLSKNSKKYRKYFWIGILIISLMCILILSTKPYLIRRLFNSDNQIVQQRMNEMKLFGSSNLQTDFTELKNYSFIYLMENYGKIYGIFIISILLLLAIKVFTNFKLVKDEFGKLLIIGLGSFIMLQCLINLFNVLNILVIGKLNLPFVTYDDCAIIINTMAISLIMSIYSRKSFAENNYKIRGQV